MTSDTKTFLVTLFIILFCILVYYAICEVRQRRWKLKSNNEIVKICEKRNENTNNK